MAEAALVAARGGSAETQRMLDDAYCRWADLAELEVANYTGTLPKKFGERGKLPRLVWRSVVPETAPREQQPHAAVAAWVGMVISEARRVCSAVTDPGAGDDDHGDVGADPGDEHGGEDGMRQHEEDLRRARARRPPTFPSRCAMIMEEISDSIDHDCPDEGHGADADALRNLKDKLHGCVRCLVRYLRTDDMSGDVDVDGVKGVDGELRTLQETCRDLEARFTAAATVDARRRWKEWIAAGIDNGAANAHAYTRAPKAWAPTAVVRPDGTVSSAMEDIMNEQRDRHRRMWRPAAGPFRYLWSERDELPQISRERIRESAATFALRTSTTYDGFHPRVIGYLSDEAIDTLSLLYAAIEASAIWPRQVSVVVAVMLPKPRGGYRSVGLAAAVYRLWAKVRREEADIWEKSNQRAYFSACKGGGRWTPYGI